MRLLLLSGAALWLCGPVAALEIPDAALGSYRTFHDEMLKAGWRPLAWEGVSAGEYPEVRCGNRICIARWTDGDQLVEITVLPRDELRLAPQW